MPLDYRHRLVCVPECNPKWAQSIIDNMCYCVCLTHRKISARQGCVTQHANVAFSVNTHGPIIASKVQSTRPYGCTNYGI